MLGLRVVIRSVENKALFWLKSWNYFFKEANQYESSVLTNTNCIREHQEILLSHSAGCLSKSVEKGKLVLGNTNKKLLSKGAYIKNVGGGAGGFYKFFKKYFVAQETIDLNISWPINFFRKYFMAPPILVSYLRLTCNSISG